MKQDAIESMGTFMHRTVYLVLAWLGTVTLGQVQDLIATVSGVVLLGYTLAKWRALRKWERAQQQQSKPASMTDAGDL